MMRFKYILSAIILGTLVFIITTASKKEPGEQTTASSASMDGFVVMELFTSQGCSSCPAADNLLAEYASRGNSNVIPLAFHVDYWNRLGWTDSFSSPRFSKRQRDYAMSIDKASIYTPQLIINGEKEFVGSDAVKIAAAVSEQLNIKSYIHISIEKIIKQGRNYTINVNLDKPRKYSTMHAALVQKKVFTNILNGENKGLKLTNYNIVRDFTSMAVASSSLTADLVAPAGYKDADFTIVIYLQDDASGKITGAIQKIL